jgi:signal transduction histidine kinase
MLEMEDLPPEVAGLLPAIGEEVGKLERIVEDFQAVLKNRKTLFVYEDLNAVVREAAGLAEKDIRRKGLDLKIETSGEPLGINMERNLLRIAVFHLIGNAVEASGNGDSITIRTMREDQKAALVISDNGKGIPPEISDRIFDPLFSTKAHGFGMGLPLVKQIVTEHMGGISVESEPGKGSSFMLWFPLRWK